MKTLIIILMVLWGVAAVATAQINSATTLLDSPYKVEAEHHGLALVGSGVGDDRLLTLETRGRRMSLEASQESTQYAALEALQLWMWGEDLPLAAGPFGNSERVILDRAAAQIVLAKLEAPRQLGDVVATAS